MKYDFDELIDRRGTDCVKWDSEPAGVLPMWVADMDFKTAPCITEALKKRVEQGIFGYTRVPESYYDAVTGWFADRHGWHIERDRIIYTSGVVPALSAIIKAETRPGDKVILQTPVYNCFFSSVRNNGCIIAENRLLRRGDTYEMDFDDLELKASDPAVRLMLLCNPHNPCGRVWRRDELKRVADICARHGVTVVSDEIHCELVMPGYEYVPFASLSPETERMSVTCVSPSKAFNIAGLQIANIVCSDPDRRARIDRAINDNEVCDVNPFGVVALQEAYRHGADWLDQLNVYLHGNYEYMIDFCRRELPRYPVMKLEGTYLAWMDVSALGIPVAILEQRLVDDARLRLNAGTMYGEAGEGYMRWNLACPRARLADGLARFAAFCKPSEL